MMGHHLAEKTMQVGMLPLFQGRPGTSDVEIYKQELELALEAEAMGFLRVESGPLVRSSYHARRALEPGDGRRET